MWKKVSGPMVAILVFVISVAACAQQSKKAHLEFGGGYAHITGDQGLNGFDVSGALLLYERVSIEFDYDGTFNTSRIGLFELNPQVGLTTAHSHLQDWIIGPHINLPEVKIKKVKRLLPFVEAQFGTSHLSTRLTTANGVSTSSSDTGFSWLLGGGLDYRIDPHWRGRFKLDFFRTHFASAGQSRLRLALGVAYTFRKR
jgi:Outer membrane protein beta-barrel domain